MGSRKKEDQNQGEDNQEGEEKEFQDDLAVQMPRKWDRRTKSHMIGSADEWLSDHI